MRSDEFTQRWLAPDLGRLWEMATVLGIFPDGSDAATLRLELPEPAHFAAGQYNPHHELGGHGAAGCNPPVHQFDRLSVPAGVNDPDPVEIEPQRQRPEPFDPLVVEVRTGRDLIGERLVLPQVLSLDPPSGPSEQSGATRSWDAADVGARWSWILTPGRGRPEVLVVRLSCQRVGDRLRPRRSAGNPVRWART
jgi:hypothetical protein